MSLQGVVKVSKWIVLPFQPPEHIHFTPVNYMANSLFSSVDDLTWHSLGSDGQTHFFLQNWGGPFLPAGRTVLGLCCPSGWVVLPGTNHNGASFTLNP